VERHRLHKGVRDRLRVDRTGSPPNLVGSFREYPATAHDATPLSQVSLHDAAIDGEVGLSAIRPTGRYGALAPLLRPWRRTAVNRHGLITAWRLELHFAELSVLCYHDP